jgi:hypothetical protein
MLDVLSKSTALGNYRARLSGIGEASIALKVMNRQRLRLELNQRNRRHGEAQMMPEWVDGTGRSRRMSGEEIGRRTKLMPIETARWKKRFEPWKRL